jgi:hypothetical protein
MTTTLADGTTRNPHSNIVTPPLLGISLGGGLKILGGNGDPNAASSDNINGHLGACTVGSLFLRTDGASASTVLYVKSALPNTWSAVTIP